VTKFGLTTIFLAGKPPGLYDMADVLGLR